MVPYLLNWSPQCLLRVFVDFEEAFVGIVHLIRPIISLSIISISVNLWENWLTDA